MCTLCSVYVPFVAFVCPEYDKSRVQSLQSNDIDMVLKVQLCQSTCNCISRNQEKCLCPNINSTIISEILPMHNYIHEWKTKTIS